MIPIIEDKELRELFSIESEEHTQIIEKGLLDLEKNPKDFETLHLIFREAHSMKGASRMLGISDIETISHILEDTLGKASKGEIEITSENIDRYYVGVDAIRKLAREATEGIPSDVNIVYVLDVLTSKIPIESESKKKKVDIDESWIDAPVKEVVQETIVQKQEIESKSEPEKKVETPQVEIPKIETSKVQESQDNQSPDIQNIINQKRQSIVHSPAEQKLEHSFAPKKEEKHKIETMRVDPTKLDALMIHAGELTVTKNIITGRVKEVNDLLSQWEEMYNIYSESTKLLHRTAENEANNPDFDSSVQMKIILSNLISQKEKIEKIGKVVTSLKKNFSHDAAKLGLLSMKLEDSIQKIRMLPLSSVFSLFNRTVRDLSRETGKDINFIIEGGETTADKKILEELKDPLMHIIRNAIDHGIEDPEDRRKAGKSDTSVVRLSGKTAGSSVIIEVTDDGKGLDPEKIKAKAIEKKLLSLDELQAMDSKQIFSIIFLHGFSTKSTVSELSGRGVGMDVVKNFIDGMKGEIEIDSELGIGTTFRLRLPTHFSTTHVLIIMVEGQNYALPTEHVTLIRKVMLEDVFFIQGKSTIIVGKEPVSVVFLSDYLDLHNRKETFMETQKPCVVLTVDQWKIGLIVDDVIDKQEVIMKPFEGIIKRIKNVSGAAILDSGDICIILNQNDLINSIIRKNISVKFKEETVQSSKVLIAEDSLTTRVQLKRILEMEGYDVSVAVDGSDAWNKISANNSYSILVTDIEMPILDGLKLTRKVRDSEKHKDLPIILVSSLATPETIKEGMEAGADAYIVKSKFDQSELLKTIKRLIV